MEAGVGTIRGFPQGFRLAAESVQSRGFDRAVHSRFELSALVSQAEQNCADEPNEGLYPVRSLGKRGGCENANIAKTKFPASTQRERGLRLDLHCVFGDGRHGPA